MFAFRDACVAEGYPDGQDMNNPDSTGVAPLPMNNVGGVRLSTALSYINPVRHWLNLTIRPNALTTRALFEGNRAVGVQVESGGETFTVEGGLIVLSAGSIASPHLLMVSGVGPRDHLSSMGGCAQHPVGPALHRHGVRPAQRHGAFPDHLLHPDG